LAAASQRPVATNIPAGAPANYLNLFKASAAKYCPGMSWTVLAAIGQIESGDGANNGPSSAGALGPMQFMPATWAEWGINGFGPPGPPDIMNPLDAIPSAARMLCAAGAGTPATLPRVTPGTWPGGSGLRFCRDRRSSFRPEPARRSGASTACTTRLTSNTGCRSADLRG